MMKSIAFALAALIASSVPALASTSSFTSSTSFLAATDSVQTLDFNSTTPGYYGTPGSIMLGGLSIGVNDNLFVQNTDAYGTGSYLTAQGATPTIVMFTFTKPVTALGFLYGAGLDFTLTENGVSTVFNRTDYPNTGYAGMTDSSPFSTAKIVTVGAGIDLDNISYGEAKEVSAAPEPSTWLLMFAGIGGIGLTLRRAKKTMGFRFKYAFAG